MDALIQAAQTLQKECTSLQEQYVTCVELEMNLRHLFKEMATTVEDFERAPTVEAALSYRALRARYVLLEKGNNRETQVQKDLLTKRFWAAEGARRTSRDILKDHLRRGGRPASWIQAAQWVRASYAVLVPLEDRQDELRITMRNLGQRVLEALAGQGDPEHAVTLQMQVLSLRSEMGSNKEAHRAALKKNEEALEAFFEAIGVTMDDLTL